MTNSPLFWWIVLTVWVVATVSDLITSYRKRKMKGLEYSFKFIYNTFAYCLNIILAAYVIVISVIPTPSLNNWLTNQLITVHTNRWVYYLLPDAYILIVIILCFWIIGKGLVPQIKYNDEEKQWRKESNDKFKNKISGWLGIKPKENAIK